MKILLSCAVALSFSVCLLHAQVARNSDLFLALQKQDSIFFERAFNRCDLAYLDTAVHKDLMFYHDKGGIQDKKVFLERVKANLCPETGPKPIRKPDPASLEVFALYDNNTLYGVIQNGVHMFYRRENGKPDTLTGKARFTHLYLLQKGQWILREVFSFEHAEAK